MKFLRTRGKETVLESADRIHPPLRAKSGLRLGGVVTAVLRKYDRSGGTR